MGPGVWGHWRTWYRFRTAPTYKQQGEIASPPDFKQQRGFTLLEIIVALAVLAVALVALLTLRNRDIALQAHARHLVTATSLAKAKLEEFNRVAEADHTESSGDFGEHYPGYAWSWDVQPTPVPKWIELTVTVTWPEGAGQEQVALTTYLSEPEGPTSTQPARL
jgi:general secretion pathway protein I